MKDKYLPGDSIIIQWDNTVKTIEFAANELVKAVEKAGCLAIKEDGNAGSENDLHGRIVLMTAGNMSDNLKSQSGIQDVSHLEAQGYSIRKRQEKNHTVWYVIGFDDYGTMSGGLDLARIIRNDGLEADVDCDKVPYIKERGFKISIPLDARTPSYSDGGDAPHENIIHMWDMDFWREFLDEMAINHYNVLSLWNLHPFPSMVKVPEYPNAALADVMKTTAELWPNLEGRDMSTPESLQKLITLKKMSIEEKIRFWQDVMEYAHNRGIAVYLSMHNIFIYGTENSGYGFTASSDDLKTKDYFRKSVKATLQTYPLLKGIIITAGENMTRNAAVDEAWLYDTYGEGINDALALDESRNFCLIHRLQYANISMAMNTFSKLNPRCRLETSFKYSQAHVYSSSKPNYIYEGIEELMEVYAEDYEEEVKDKEAFTKMAKITMGYGDRYLESIGDHKTWLTVRDDDYYMLRGGSDPEFIRTYIKTMPYEKLKGFYIGADGLIWGRECVSKNPDTPRALILKKRWYSFLLWGRIAYDPDISQEYFIKILGEHFSDIDAEKLFHAWAKASQIIPFVNRFHNSDCIYDFQWYPEACSDRGGFQDINRFIKTKPQRNEGIIGIKQYTEALLKNKPVSQTTPVDIAQSLMDTAEQTLLLADGIALTENKELRETVGDIKAMAMLGKYYSVKILGALYKHLADRSTDTEQKAEYKKTALNQLTQASEHWREYAKVIGSQYIPQVLSRLIPEKDSPAAVHRDINIVRLQADVDKDITLI